MPPITPGTTRRLSSLRSTLPSIPCEMPDAPVVKTSAACTLALAVAGGRPIASRMDEDVRP
jgi:hypothetical protein